MASINVKPDLVNGGVNVTAGQQAQADNGDNAECKCGKEQWPVLIVVIGFVVAFLLCLVSVLSLLTFENGVGGVILNVYVCILALLALSAEMRRFKFCRNLIYTYMKFFYFLTSYFGRALFYVFLGTIVLANSPLNIAIGVGTIVFGVVMFGAHLVVGLPNYIDDKAVQEETEYRVAAANQERFRAGDTPGAYTPASPKESSYSTPTVPPPGSSQPGNPPRTNPYGPGGAASATVPPQGRETDYMSNQPQHHEDPYEDEDPITPAQRRKDEDARLEAEYYAASNANANTNNASAVSDNSAFSPVESNSRTNRYDDDPFAKDDDTYKPPRF